MDRFLKEIIDNLEVKENYIDNEGSYIEYVETKELNKIFNYVISKQKIKDKIEEYLEFDKKYKSYTKDGRENFTIEYYKAKTLEELLEEGEENE